MVTIRMSIGAAVLVALGASLGGCHRYQVSAPDALDTPVQRETTPVLLVTEPLLRGDPSPLPTFRTALDLTEALSDETGLPVIAPWELELPEGASWPRMSNLVEALMLSHPTPSAEVLVVYLELREDASSRVVRNSGSFDGPTYSEGEDIEVYVSVTRAGTTRPIGEISVAFEEDPFHPDATAYEPRPQLRDAIQQAAAEVVRLVHDAYGEPPGQDVSIATAYYASNALTYGGGLGAPVADTWVELDTVDAMVAERTTLECLGTGVEPDMHQMCGGQPAGLLVASAEGWIGDCVAAGDYIVSVDDRPAWGEHVLRRAALLRESDDHLELVVHTERGEEERSCRPSGG